MPRELFYGGALYVWDASRRQYVEAAPPYPGPGPAPNWAAGPEPEEVPEGDRPDPNEPPEQEPA
jgi:hypothetical protein